MFLASPTLAHGSPSDDDDEAEMLGAAVTHTLNMRSQAPPPEDVFAF